MRAGGLGVGADLDQRGSMHALAIDQHQRLVGRKAAQVGRTHEGRAVADRVARDREGGDQILEHLVHVGHALLLQFLARIDVDGRGRFRDRAVGATGSGDDDRLPRRGGRILRRLLLSKNRQGIDKRNGDGAAGNQTPILHSKPPYVSFCRGLFGHAPLWSSLIVQGCRMALPKST